MKPKTYKILEMCVENGVAYGYMRAYKYDEAPSREDIENAIVNAVMGEMWEWFDLGEDNEQTL